MTPDAMRPFDRRSGDGESITRRDYFAGLAMQAFIMRMSAARDDRRDAMMAWKMADMMLTQRDVFASRT